MDVTVSRTINAPRTKVLDYVVDLRNDTAWRKSVTSSELLSGVPGKPGAQFGQVISAMGNPTNVQVTLVAVDGDVLRYKGEGGMMPIEFAMSISGDDASSDVSMTLSADIPPAMAKMASRMMEAETVKDLDALAAVLESA
jgi:carbon monoxide dehydrogenase subunit G